MPRQPDYLGDVGRVPRVLAMLALGGFALVFGAMAVISAIGVLVTAIRGEWDITPILAGGAAAWGLLAAGFGWLYRRIRTPAAPGQVVVFPLWFIQLVGALLLPAAVYSCYAALTRGQVSAAGLSATLGPPVAMLLVPWLVRRRRAALATIPVPAAATPSRR